MSNPRLSRLAADILAEEHANDAGPSREDDARAIVAIEAAIRGNARRQRLRRGAVAGALAIAATVALFAGWRAVRSPSPLEASRSVPGAATATLVSAQGNVLSDGVVVHRQGRELTLDSSVGLESSDRVVTAATGRAAITLSTGTHLVVAGSSDFTVAEQGPMTAFSIAAGSVHADVAKLRAGERFLIRTPDGEVEVRGTSFEVSVVTPSPSCGEGTRTRVAVTEGVVVVRSGAHEDSVRKGESWPRDCVSSPASPLIGSPAVHAAAATAPSAEMTPTPLASPSPVPASAVAPLTAAAGPSAAPSELAAQNAIFGEAVAARRRGEPAAAIAAYERLTARYPSSPLAENAYVERMRLLGASDPRRGADAARAYLARYPHGFARAEANDLVEKAR